MTTTRTELTREERLAAAAVCETWPANCGDRWLLHSEAHPGWSYKEAAAALAEHPEWVAFSSPEVAVAALRGDLSEAGLQLALDDLSHWFTSRHFENFGNYLTALDDAPKAVARLLREEE